MNEVTRFLSECGVFYVATADGDQPRVRPFGAVLEHEGRIYCCTGNRKEFYRQCAANPRVEICACKPGGQWLRVAGSIVFDGNMDVKKKFFETNPGLAGIYQSPDGPNFEVFYMKDAQATFYSFAEAPRTVAI